jgi:hypothetical protein
MAEMSVSALVKRVGLPHYALCKILNLFTYVYACVYKFINMCNHYTLKGYSKGYSKMSYTLSQTLVLMLFYIYNSVQCIVYIT